ncbi:energy-coupling factor transporter transmembrane component T family protein [Methermicoccus shengliensis]|uniref:Energy-coupling factor transporter transmembrane protein EcfT n=1 Tax=Methermicoccus shengliensis TaxID=660064 RepID=A0A832VX81_9EURY|nr:energy-coupling factor transporter transmembrane component T [Methermicoccus shengliensis]MDI3488624.1 energy-coupling factor transport system permease protein [Methanosarcinales archaeon]MDN5295400.1 energy-coupling factor transport system permease protein [Methanosarcinales archaeon]HIH69513.1 energy-coupling factor transporter transmembrane protein EcfT [Methermicoccus shengliensis]
MITFRYEDRDTPVHRTSAVVKLIWVVDVLTLSLIFDDPIYLVLLFAATLPVVYVGHIAREWFSVIRFVVFLAPMIVALNVAFNHNGSHVLYQAGVALPFLGTPTITLEALVYGLMMSVRLLAILSAFAILTFTVHPDDLMLLMLKLKVPYRSVLVTSMSTRFLPTLIEDARTITDVQRSRGLEVDRGNIIQRIKNRVPILVPLVANSLDRAVQIAEAMESRAFGSSKKRTFYRELELSRWDKAMALLMLTPLVLGLLGRLLFGLGTYRYYPSLEPITLEPMGAVALLVVLLVLNMLSIPQSRLQSKQLLITK